MIALALAVLTITVYSSRLNADTQACGGQVFNLPFMDVGDSPFFCQIAEAFFDGLTNGTSPTTFSPNNPVTREQMAAFVTRTQDSALRRGSRRAALNQWGTTHFSTDATTTVGVSPKFVQSDGVDIWVANNGFGTVSRVRASDGRLLDTWIGATGAFGVVVAQGRIFVSSFTNPGQLYKIDPTQPPGTSLSPFASLPGFPEGITTDGSFIWTANITGSVSRINPVTGNVATFTAGFQEPIGILYDGSDIWVTDLITGSLLRLNSEGGIAQTVPVGSGPLFPVFDGTNIWVPNGGANTITVVKASTGAVLATLSGNGLSQPTCAAFDGQRILVTSFDDTVSLWNAADLTPIRSILVTPLSTPFGACSDGVNFWVTFGDQNTLARF